MTLTKYKLGSLIEMSEKRNDTLEYGVSDVRGISIQKKFINTKADMKGVSLHPYYLVKPDNFAYVTVTSRNGDKITIAHNTTKNVYIVSSSYVVFYIKKKDILLSDYLFMYLNRPEFDRYSRFNSWGSAREMFSWEDMCDVELELPPIDIQKKYVAIYQTMLANQRSYEKGLEDLKIVFEGHLDDLRRKENLKSLGNYLELIENKNSNLKYGVDSVRGISIEKRFIETKADMKGVNLRPYAVVKPNQFAYVTVTSRNGNKISLAMNDSDEPYICSSSYVVFQSKDEDALLPKFLMLYFSRSEFDRYARFHSWGSARETFDWDEMRDVKIPIPDISVQKAIADIYSVYKERQHINEKLKEQIKKICPILIKGSLEEAGI